MPHPHPSPTPNPHPGAGTHRGSRTHLGSGTDRESGTHRGLDVQPGVGTHPGSGGHRRSGVLPGAEVAPEAGSRAAVHPVKDAALATVAALAALMLLAVAGTIDPGLFALPFVASAGIVALAPAAPFAQPRSIVLGHASAALLALIATALAGPSVWTASVAAALSIGPMLLLRAPHPPAAATAALIGLTAPDPIYLLNPVLIASVLVIAGGAALGKVLPGRKYPAYWR